MKIEQHYKKGKVR